MSWEKYDHPTGNPNRGEFLAYKAKFDEWQRLAQNLAPSPANELRKNLGLRPNDAWNPNPLAAQALQLAKQEYRRTGDGPCPHPSVKGEWILD